MWVSCQKIFFSSIYFPFADRELMFQGREHMFKVCEHMFKGLEQKKYNMENKNPLSRKIKNNREAEKKLFLSLQRDCHQAYHHIIGEGAQGEAL